jgi:orotate phosphoribosyltransferase
MINVSNERERNKRAGFVVTKKKQNGTRKPHVKGKQKEDHKRKTDIVDDVTSTWSSSKLPAGRQMYK